ncbi:MAG: hypothetical protein OXB84_08270, partial [Halobacteriovoraceae bacterium]|nr:hypothetical protein [Halobacteriovoraceae bacterium]
MKRKYLFKLTALFFIMSIFLINCSKKGTNLNKIRSKDTSGSGVPGGDISINEEITRYYEVASGHNINSNVILLVSQGGPSSVLASRPYTDSSTGASESAPEFMNWYPYFNVVHVHQAQTLAKNSEVDGLDARLLSGDKIISMAESRKAALKSAEILYKVAKHFKDQEKTVYVLTHSFGSFVILHTLAYHENVFDKIVVTAGRVDMPLTVVNAFKNRCGGTFAENAVDFTVKDCSEIQQMNIVEKNKLLSGLRLQAAFGENRYSRLLGNKNLDNLMYVYGSRDESVGKLSSSEITFLRNKDAVVLEKNSDHTLPDLEALPDSKTAKGMEGEDKSKVFNFLQSPLVGRYSTLEISDDNFNLYLGDESDDESDKFDIAII